MSTVFLLCISKNLQGQDKLSKPLITDTSYLSWTSVDNGILSNNGKFVFYRIKNEPLGRNTWVIIATDKSWEIRSAEYTNLKFSANNKYVYAMKGDNLVQIKLKSDEIKIISHCKDYRLYSKDKIEWLIYTLNDTLNSLVIQNLKTTEKLILNNIQEYDLNENAATIITNLKSTDAENETMQETDLINNQSKIIYKGAVIKNKIFDQSGNQMAFETINKGETQIWYYERNWNSAKFIASDTSEGISENLKITTDGNWRFSSDGSELFFNLTKKSPSESKKSNGPSIWNYKDLYLWPQYKIAGGQMAQRGEYFSALNLKTGKIQQLLFGNQKVTSESLEAKNNEVLIVESSSGFIGEASWIKSAYPSYFLLFVKTGKIVPIKENCLLSPYPMQLSPKNDFLIYFDYQFGKYVSYDVKSQKTNIISKSLNRELFYLPFSSRPGVDAYEGTPGIIGWLDGQNKVLVMGKYDIWELDISGQLDPVNLTKGIGAEKRITFSYLKETEINIIKNGSIMMLLGFNTETKISSLYSLNRKTSVLKEIYSGSEYFAQPYEDIENVKKAKNLQAYLLYFGNVRNSPNYIYTTNFKTFDTLSYVHPEAKYNWLSSDIAFYNDKFGNKCQGILYKPENFDSTVKYPVILHYYLESSNHLNEPIEPKSRGIGINIPLLVSNGYLVFMPNIYYLGRKIPGESAVTSVLAAADYLAKFSWVDVANIGVLGHSYGGFETNYIISHTNRFRAAISSAGISNLIDFYNSWHTAVGVSNQSYTKNVLWLMEEGPEAIPNDYVKNSPILDVKNIMTPLLLMHNEEDPSVMVAQSTRLFVQLRSMQKPVWLLQYAGEGHGLIKPENKIDYQDKVKGFFDYYLKGKPIPEWMNNPIE